MELKASLDCLIDGRICLHPVQNADKITKQHSWNFTYVNNIIIKHRSVVKRSYPCGACELRHAADGSKMNDAWASDAARRTGLGWSGEEELWASGDAGVFPMGAILVLIAPFAIAPLPFENSKLDLSDFQITRCMFIRRHVRLWLSHNYKLYIIV